MAPRVPVNRRSFLKHSASALGALGFARLASAQSAREVRDYSLVAASADIEVAPGQVWRTWAYNGQVPGPTIRATQGERIRVVLENRLDVPTTIHWHGVPLPNAMDGVPGLTQEPVEPGGSFIYEFDANVPGTYFYHSHVGLQLDRGLLGSLVIDPATPEGLADREFLLFLDDWLPGSPDEAMAAMMVTTPGMGGGMMGGGMAGGTSLTDPPYAGFLANGRLGTSAEPFTVTRGERVRFRIVNGSAATTHRIGLVGHRLTVTHSDGQAVAPVDVDSLVIGMGERYDVVVRMDNSGTWPLLAGSVDSVVPGIVLPVVYAGERPTLAPVQVWPPSLMSGKRLAYSDLRPLIGSAVQASGRSIPLTLSAGANGTWTINGQAYPNADPFQFRLGERIRFQFRNMSMLRHPMHLHGHFFQLVDRTTGRASGPVKDTVIVEPMIGAVDVDWVADNPGRWLLHCHHAYHMEMGMVREVRVV
jgi:FtsP/CotA-like multicopper oxidase with cupredoxin domain